ncbi:hypothetical protein AFV7_gp43 [Betalipothrixvirus pezzuloense]|uniref:Uncharacterized protein n=1 Tax=Betalipothrixvirus pezzuloense TaxID=346883 RepID=A7WKR0_9VIRU|nr:hypothetical protein AFV7_gp43 [Acidianus filamentous virus 7]CAJ31663.1 conserved hypothetical protein [Acidianus filamentous virus 7]
MIIRGEVTLKTVDGRIIKSRNTIVNLSVLLNIIVRTTSTPSSLLSPYIQTNAGDVTVTTKISTYENGYQFSFSGSLPTPSNIISMFLYPGSLSLFTLPLASIVYSRPVTGVTTITWDIYVIDETGLLYNALLPQTIPSTNILTALYAVDNNVNALLPLQSFERYVYAYLFDSAIFKPISYVNAHYFTFLDYTTAPTATVISNRPALQLVPASGSQYSVFYFLSNSSTFVMQFSFSSGSSPPQADGFAICMFSQTPPIALNTASVTGMQNSTLAYGQGEQVCVEYDPYDSQPFSVTIWNSNGYVQTVLSVSGAGSGSGLTANDIYQLEIQISGNTLSVTVVDLTSGTTVASTSVTLPFSPTPPGYVIVTTRTSSNYANWSLVNLQAWYPYSVQLGVKLTAPKVLPITAIFESG